MDPISLFKQTKYSSTVWWKLKTNIQGYKYEIGNDLVTEILKNRSFRLVEKELSFRKRQDKSRILVQLLEDGYLCWVNKNQLSFEQLSNDKTGQVICDQYYINSKIPFILNWIIDQSNLSNQYLWGGTIGPDYDCSGLIQTAFLKYNIFLPRDSYQMKNFCSNITNFYGNINYLQMGDLLFFGNQSKCDHVGIYFKDGNYYHASGKDNGRNGIGIDNLVDARNSVSKYYKSNFISAGRVHRSYKWNKTLR